MVIIWPLALKLHPLMAQQRPRWTGWRGIPEWPTMPWNEEDRPPQINFGRVDLPPTAAYTAPSNFGLCALNLVSIQKKLLRAVPYSAAMKYPGVVHELKPIPPKYYSISGVTRDSAGAALGNCTVHLIGSTNDAIYEQKVSDASGAFEFRSASPKQNFYLVAYKPGSPDVAGTTINTLIGT